MKFNFLWRVLLAIFPLDIVSADDPLAGMTQGYFDGKRPFDAVQLVGERGHILIPESGKIESQWVLSQVCLQHLPSGTV